jgi:hypothetical protein
VVVLARRVSRGARPKLEHTMLAVRNNGLLGFHCCQSRIILTAILARPRAVLQKMLAHGADAKV